MDTELTSENTSQIKSNDEQEPIAVQEFFDRLRKQFKAKSRTIGEYTFQVRQGTPTSMLVDVFRTNTAQDGQIAEKVQSYIIDRNSGITAIHTQDRRKTEDHNTSGIPEMEVLTNDSEVGTPAAQKALLFDQFIRAQLPEDVANATHKKPLELLKERIIPRVWFTKKAA